MKNNIKTYAVGSGEITLTLQDAEELRLILQTEHLYKVVTELIDQRIDCFSFPTPATKRHFIDEMVHLNDDLINYDSSYYEEMLLENIFLRAEAQGIAR